MRLLKILSIRSLLVFLVLSASLPPIALVAWGYRNSGKQAVQLVLQNALEVAKNLSTAQKVVDTYWVSTLDLLVKNPAVSELRSADVQSLFSYELNKLKALDNILLVDISGDVLVSAKEASGDTLWEIFSSDVPFSSAPSVGKSLIKTENGNLNIYVPYIQTFSASGDNTPRYAVVLLVGTSFFEENVATEKLALSIVDASGTCLLHLPESHSKQEGTKGEFFPPSLWRYIQTHEDAGSFIGRAISGQERIYGYNKMRLSPDSSVYSVAIVSFGIEDVVGDEKVFVLQSLLLTLAFTLAGVLLAGGVGRTLLVGPIDRLVKANNSFTMGDLTSRVGIENGIQEILVLSRSFDDMAAVLEAQDIKRRSENQKIKDQAHRDYLTGSYNRRGGLIALERLVAEVTEQKTLLSIFFIDIDFFKAINDQYGHNEGDKMLKRVTLLLERHLRSRDVLCRYGGDEFLVILPGCAYEAARDVWTRIQKEIKRINGLKKLPYVFSLSHGLAVYDPTEPVSIEQLIAEADFKMYEEKARHKAER